MNTKYQDFSLDDWLKYIQIQHWRTMDLTLERISRVWENLEGQCAGFTLIVAGTNGKGSCVSLLDGVFQQAGKSTGAFTSPHLVRFNERIRINGQEASDDEICSAFRNIESARGANTLTYFEYGTLAALLVFQQHNVDVAILEVGMGGRLDAVNMIDNDLVLITSIGIDHEQWLGMDLDKIAAEKAGVIKTNGLVVCADTNMPNPIKEIADKNQAVLLAAGKEYSITSDKKGVFWQSNHPAIPRNWRSIGPVISPFSGEHQVINLGGVIACLALTSEQTGVAVDHLQSGFNRVSLTARCQIIQDEFGQNPEIVIDVAHNKDSAVELSRFLKARPGNGETYAVLGVLEDKPLSSIVDPMVGLIDHWILVSLGGERGQTGEQLGYKLDKVVENTNWTSVDSPVDGYLYVMEKAKPEDRIVIFGSFYTVGDIIGHIEQLS